MKRLPIDAYRDRIQNTFADHQTVILTAPTGSGKSVGAPWFVAETGRRVIVTEPRIVAAKSVSRFVAKRNGVQLGTCVGYQTAQEAKCNRDTQLLYCTDGLQLVRTLAQGIRDETVLFIDESHEGNLNISELMAWCAHMQDQGEARFKLGIMSATQDTSRLSEFYGGAPVIELPGSERMFDIEDCEASEHPATIVANSLQAGRNVLFFLPGVAEINEWMGYVRNELRDRNVAARLLPLHGSLDPDEQDRVFERDSVPTAVFATNIAEASVTIEYIDDVVDSGLERSVVLKQGFEQLIIGLIARSRATQRKGRAGRTKPGRYYDCSEYFARRLELSLDDRPEYPTAEILNCRLDKTVLRFAEAGIDAAGLRFFDQPRKARFEQAKEDLWRLGCLTDDGKVTKTGRFVCRLPVSVEYGRMVAETLSHNKADEDMVSIAALLEQRGITLHRLSREWGNHTGGEQECDPLAQLHVFKWASSVLKNKGAGSRKERREMLKDAGVMLKALEKTRNTRGDLVRALRSAGIKLETRSDRNAILRAIAAGLVRYAYKRSGGRFYLDKHENERELANDAVWRRRGVTGPDFVVGLPFDLELEDKRYGGTFILKLLTMATKVDAALLCELAPHLIRRESGLYPRTNSEGVRVSTTQTYFNGLLLDEKEEPVAEESVEPEGEA